MHNYIIMSVTVGRDRPNTGWSVFDRSDRGLKEEEINGADNYFKSLLDFFYLI